jgi:hypothetical protein
MRKIVEGNLIDGVYNAKKWIECEQFKNEVYISTPAAAKYTNSPKLEYLYIVTQSHRTKSSIHVS